jgi:uncharacterized coiled-coil DUF342 family protein
VRQVAFPGEVGTEEAAMTLGERARSAQRIAELQEQLDHYARLATENYAAISRLRAERDRMAAELRWVADELRAAVEVLTTELAERGGDL